MNKKLVRLTESDLHRIVKESVKRTIRESNEEISINEYFEELLMACKSQNKVNELYNLLKTFAKKNGFDPNNETYFDLNDADFYPYGHY